MKIGLAVASVIPLACAPAREAPAQTEGSSPFRDATETSGVRFRHCAGKSPEKHLPETMGAGAAIVDVNEDGALDLYFVQGGALRGAGCPGFERNELYAGDGSGSFTNVSAASGAAADAGYGMGVAAGDANGDGHVDLFVTNLGPDVLVQGDGQGFFVDATERAGLTDPRWTTSALFLDPDADGDLDLYVCGYLEIDLDNPEWCGEREPEYRSYCHPDQFTGIRDTYWRNRGDGKFEDATEAAGLSDSAGKGLGVIAFDYDDDGAIDLYVANDSVENRLWRGLGDGTFEDATLLSATGVNGRGATEAGMGVAVADVDHDARFDLFVTNFDDESNTLYLNEGDGFFRDATAAAGLDAPSRLPVGFGTAFLDYDLDGDQDLAVANGHIIDNIELYHDGKTHAQLAHLYANDAGRFALADAGELGRAALVGRGLYRGDLNGDGVDDLVVTQCNRDALVLFGARNARPALKIKGGPVGGQLELGFTNGEVARLVCGPQPTYLGQSAHEVILGLGGRRLATLRVRPNGEPWQTLELDGGARKTLELEYADGKWRIAP